MLMTTYNFYFFQIKAKSFGGEESLSDRIFLGLTFNVPQLGARPTAQWPIKHLADVQPCLRNGLVPHKSSKFKEVAGHILYLGN